MASYTNVGTGGGIDTTAFTSFAKALRTAAAGVSKQLTLRLRAAGAIVADAAKVNASGVSTTIPPTIKTRVRSTTVSVVAGGGNVAIAGLFEAGNKGKGAGGGTFRHPVFGTAVWVEQPMHPFLYPALVEHQEEVWQGALEALDWAIEVAAYDDAG
jgi:hypothetical protein